MENSVAETDITLEHSTAVEKNIQENVNHHYQDQEEIERRLLELDEEWDIERILQVKAAAITVAGIALGMNKDKRWLTLPIAFSTLTIANTLFRVSPASALMKAFGFRSRAEIEKGKYALKALRGDFNNIIPVPNAVWNAVNK